MEMTREELQTIIDSQTKKWWDIYDLELAAFERKDESYSFTQGFNTWSNMFLERKVHTTDFFGDNIDDLKDLLDRHEERLEEFKQRYIHVSDRGLYTENDSEYGETTCELQITYSNIINKDSAEYNIKKKVKDHVNILIKPKGQRYAQEIDCNVLKLFLEGNIDFKTMQKLTYTNCEI